MWQVAEEKRRGTRPYFDGMGEDDIVHLRHLRTSFVRFLLRLHMMQTRPFHLDYNFVILGPLWEGRVCEADDQFGWLTFV